MWVKDLLGQRHCSARWPAEVCHCPAGELPRPKGLIADHFVCGPLSYSSLQLGTGIRWALEDLTRCMLLADTVWYLSVPRMLECGRLWHHFRPIGEEEKQEEASHRRRCVSTQTVATCCSSSSPPGRRIFVGFHLCPAWLLWIWEPGLAASRALLLTKSDHLVFCDENDGGERRYTLKFCQISFCVCTDWPYSNKQIIRHL